MKFAPSLAAVAVTAICAASCAAFATPVHANLLDADTLPVGTSIVFETDFGDFTVGLFDPVTPLTVQNFIKYAEGTTVNGGAYNPGLFHRLDPGNFLQAGFANLSGNTISVIPEDAPVPNEPLVSNTLGTISMVKVDGDPNSATSQFLFNLDDNSADFDNQNGGITAFGRVTSGLDVLINGAAGLTPANFITEFGPEYTQTPVKDFASGPFAFNLVAFSVTVLPAPTIPSDFNGDGTVDLIDFDILASNFGTVGGKAQGDANGDGVVTLLDFDVLAQEFGSSLPAAVPEPASASLLALAGLAALRRRRG
ncbi:MAG: peptidylprolyl isomerase [Planctomycetota bacterium]